MALVNYVFYICLLKKCVEDPMSIVSFESFRVKESLPYEEVLVEILDHHIWKSKNEKHAFINVLWRNQLVEGSSRKAKADKVSKYPDLFPFTLILTWGIKLHHSFFLIYVF